VTAGIGNDEHEKHCSRKRISVCRGISAIGNIVLEPQRGKSHDQPAPGSAARVYRVRGVTTARALDALLSQQELQRSLLSAKRDLVQNRIELKRTWIKAPFNVIVQSRAVKKGIRADTTTILATLVGTDAYWVAVSVPVSQLRWITIPQTNGDQGSLVRICNATAWSQGMIIRHGRVMRLEAELEEQGRMVQPIIRVEDPLCLQPENADKPRKLIGSLQLGLGITKNLFMGALS